MRAVSVACPKCGADLRPEPGKAKCQYCGKETWLRATGQEGHPVVVVERGDGRRRGLWIGIAVAVVVVGLIPVWVLPSLVGQSVSTEITVTRTDGSSVVLAGGSEDALARAEAAGRAAQSAADEARRAMAEALGKAGVQPPADPSAPKVRSRVCLLDDLDGDGARELSVLLSAGGRDRARAPAILDGASGRVRWRGEPLGDDSSIHLLCVTPGWVAAVNNDSFELLLANAHEPTKQVRRALSDELDFYGFDDTCIALRTSDQRTLGLSTEDGAERDCGARARRRPHIGDTTTCGIISTLRRGASFEGDDITYQLNARRPGTPFLQASASRGRRELWDVPLRLVPASGEAIGCFVGVATPGVFVVLGAPRGDSHALTALGLNAESGTERWSVDLPGTHGSVHEVHYNGRYVVLGLLNRALALDPASGDPAWQVGG